MFPVMKRSSGGSPRYSSMQNASNTTPSKFKTPMSFSPREAPSPSRKELWKRELGFDDIEVGNDGQSDLSSSDDDDPEVDQNDNKWAKRSKVEIEALELELERKEKQKDEILSRLKEKSDKINSYRRELERTQEAKRNQLKIMKKTYETHLNEKEETIQSLHEIIEEQDNKIIELHSKMIGESSTDSDDNISIYRSVKKLTSVDQGEPTPANKATIEQLEQEKTVLVNNISDLENELSDHKRKNLDWEHRFESEVSSLRNSIRQTEAKYSEVTSTPPKVIVKTVIPEENLRKIDELRALNRQLEGQVAVLKEQNSAEMKSSETSNKRLGDELTHTKEMCAKQKNQLQELESQLMSSRNMVTSLGDEKSQLNEKVNHLTDNLESTQQSLDGEKTQRMTELKQSQEEFKQFQQVSESKIEQLTLEIETSVNEAVEKTENKYSKMLANYENTKKMVMQLGSSTMEVRKEHKNIRKEMMIMASMIQPAIKETQKSICKAIADIDSRSKILVERYRKEMRLRKKYFNQVVELKGNIRVFCRVRPVIKEDGSGQQSANVISYDDEDDAVINVEHRGNNKEFEVDRVFKPNSTQTEVFNEVQSLVTSCIDGYNVCIFAYGQTGSGKTFTMEGTAENPGINPRALQLLFNDLQERLDWNYSISMSLLEIYNESIRDLLGANPVNSLDIKQGKEGVHVPGLEEVHVENVEDVHRVFSLGHKNRSTASTNMNEYSSRSHAVLVIKVVGINKNTGTKTMGRLNLVDLAGSERVSKSGAEGARMKEAQNINKSLSSLGDVIQALKSKSTHIPYRNSKLTYLLQGSLGGDSKTLMVVQVAPVKKNAGETFCSLDFASRVRNVELGQATKRVDNAESSQRGDTPKKGTPKKRT
eukprot:Seg61.8 transcript_id=Seg61.8/GoldUCD/mRNA.D3Y31 product="Kinesin-like protein KIFC3" protein_id=Seg61.8/GoldUCD/D3Y31